MSSTVIVAIPDRDDPIWKISSEKVPHLTLLYIEDLEDPSVIKHVWEHVAHSAHAMLNKFYLDVSSRGTLGDDSADVVFFDHRYVKDLKEFRSQLIADPMIAKAYLSVEQHPQWTPHLTLGYPTSPAKKGEDEKIWGVRFGEIALWTEDYDGPSFPLQQKEYGFEGEVAMSDRVSKHLEHYGIKGMRWGRRKADGTSAVEVTTKAVPGKKVVAKGGQNHPAAPDAVRVAKLKQKAKVSTTDALDTKELQDLVNRLNLEQQYSRLTSEKSFFDKIDGDKKKVDKLIGAGQTANNVYNFVNSPMGKLLKSAVEKKTGIKLGRR